MTPPVQEKVEQQGGVLRVQGVGQHGEEGGVVQPEVGLRVQALLCNVGTQIIEVFSILSSATHSQVVSRGAPCHNVTMLEVTLPEAFANEKRASLNGFLNADVSVQ